MQEWEELAYAKEEGISEGYQRGKDDAAEEFAPEYDCEKIYYKMVNMA